MKHIVIFLITLLCTLGVKAKGVEQFVSLTLCSDRLLIELARPEQISAMSSYSRDPQMMLDKINRDKPLVEAQLSQLLPYLNHTVLINEQFYPQLAAQLKALGVRIFPINDTPQNAEEFFTLLRTIGDLTGNRNNAEALITRLISQHTKLNRPLTKTLLLSETGVIDLQPQHRTLLALLGLSPLENSLTPQNFSLEKVLLAQPNVLISFADKRGYNLESELLSHPVLQRAFQHQPLAELPLKYSYCFDHGIWLGASQIYSQLAPAVSTTQERTMQ